MNVQQIARLAELEMLLRKMGHEPRLVERSQRWPLDGYVCIHCGYRRYSLGRPDSEDAIAACLALPEPARETEGMAA